MSGRKGGSCYDLRGPTGPFLRMPNIKQQKKRVSIAARQRVENLRYRTSAKTLRGAGPAICTA